MGKLADLISQGFGLAEDYNCAEKIIYGANQVYDLGLDPAACKLAAGFGAGCGIGHLCGTLAAGCMVLSHRYVRQRAHESNLIPQKTDAFLHGFEQQMGSLMCENLKRQYRTEEKKCYDVIYAAALALDQVLAAETA